MLFFCFISILLLFTFSTIRQQHIVRKLYKMLHGNYFKTKLLVMSVVMILISWIITLKKIIYTDTIWLCKCIKVENEVKMNRNRTWNRNEWIKWRVNRSSKGHTDIQYFIGSINAIRHVMSIELQQHLWPLPLKDKIRGQMPQLFISVDMTFLKRILLSWKNFTHLHFLLYYNSYISLKHCLM